MQRLSTQSAVRIAMHYSFSGKITAYLMKIHQCLTIFYIKAQGLSHLVDTRNAIIKTRKFIVDNAAVFGLADNSSENIILNIHYNHFKFVYHFQNNC
jgi:hypothetical protein